MSQNEKPQLPVFDIGQQFYRDRVQDRETKFQELPQWVQQRHQTDPTIHFYVTAYLCGHVDREEMFEGMAESLAGENDLRYKRLLNYDQFFGLPPMVVFKPQS